jgi:phage anti-repressor protein
MTKDEAREAFIAGHNVKERTNKDAWYKNDAGKEVTALFERWWRARQCRLYRIECKGRTKKERIK